LDIPQPNAYACPGGYIFITKGMLSVLTNEAELACILAHEVAHVSRFHGLKELAERKNQIAADAVFGELDEELPDAYNEEDKLTEQELEDEAFGMFETVFQGRLDAYEQEADALGMRYAVRAGYDPKAMRSVLTRMVTQGAKSNNEHYRPDILQKRLQWVDTDLAKRKYPSDLQTNKSRWQKYAVK
jgi:predicted Zn-dependent protease